MAGVSVNQALARARVANLNLSGYVTAEESTRVADVIQLMRTHDRTTALITRDGRLIGIFTERDVLRKVLGRPEAGGQPVSALMTPDPVTLNSQDTVLEAVRRMNVGHFRDLPVLDATGRILGNLTDNAVVRRLCDELQTEVLNLPPDPAQILREVDGA